MRKTWEVSGNMQLGHFQMWSWNKFVCRLTYTPNCKGRLPKGYLGIFPKLGGEGGKKENQFPNKIWELVIFRGGGVCI